MVASKPFKEKPFSTIRSNLGRSAKGILEKLSGKKGEPGEDQLEEREWPGHGKVVLLDGKEASTRFDALVKSSQTRPGFKENDDKIMV